ncbi:hypothetical protein Ciccas_003754 [Cichlidogyrus casuarinus]|uniref:G-protein coupled receptors family 1 profile domain-containing protein n=1 Tax=Cichlidogyrus casuarinus TaxID=1844966 RepID=A0ABD2QDF6_9PLAT
MVRNSSNWPSPHVSLVYTPWQLTLVAPALTVLTIWTALGNSLVMVAVFKYPKLRSMSNALIANLALSDLLLAVTVMPFTTTLHLTGMWLFGNTFCDIWLSVDVLWCTASVWNLVVIASDRFTATNFPVWYRHRRKDLWTGIYIVSVWTLAILISLPGMVNVDSNKGPSFKLDKKTDTYMCELFSEKNYVIYSAIGSFILPFFIMMVLYAKIFAVLSQRGKKLRQKQVAKRSALLMNETGPQETAIDDGTSDETVTGAQQLLPLQGQSNGNNSKERQKKKRRFLDVKPGYFSKGGKGEHEANDQERADRRERRATKRMAPIIIFFAICWIPFTLFYLIRGSTTNSEMDSDNHMHLQIFLYWLGYANSALNPVLYAVLNNDFRNAFISILRCTNM